MQSKLDRPDGTKVSQAKNRILGALLVIETLGMDAAYRMMAEERQREREALEWAEVTVGDATDAVLEVAGQPERKFIPLA